MSSVSNGSAPPVQGLFYMLGGVIGFITIWYCLLYSAWHFMKKRDVKNIIVGILVVCFLLLVPGIVSVPLAIALYLYQKKIDSRTITTVSQQ